MGEEIERKFLVRSDKWRAAADRGRHFIQGYFDGGPGAPTMRVRVICDREAWLTIKGKPTGFRRSEFEYPIPVPEAMAMLKEFCGTRVVEKIRYLVPAGGDLVWEIDEYCGLNCGLFTAEIELPSEDTRFVKPRWVGREVSGDPDYTNGALSRRPWTTRPEVIKAAAGRKKK